MAQLDVREQLVQRFAAPLPACAARRIVVWHDPAGEFAEAFVDLAGASCAEGEDADGLPGTVVQIGEAPVRCVEVADGNTFAVQRMVYRQAADANFLLYRRCARGQLEGDWLADVELYAEHFQADYVSMLIDRLDAVDVDEVRDALGRCSTFFAAKSRVVKFERLVPHAASADEVERGVVAVALSADDAGAEAIVRAYVTALFEHAREQEGAIDADLSSDEPGVQSESEPEALACVRKYGAEDALARLLKRVLGYDEGLSDGDALTAHLLITALSATMSESALLGLERFVAAPCAPFARTIVRAWADAGEAAVGVLSDMCRFVEGRLHLPQRFANLDSSQLMESDAFPAIDEAILLSLMGSLAEGADRREEAAEALRVRREMEWYEQVRPYYECLREAAALQSFRRENAAGFHASCPRDVWNDYVDGWWRMDAHYRAFARSFAECVKVGNPALDDAVRGLAAWADTVYAGWFLPELNACWTQTAAADWEASGFVADVPRQTCFYDDEVSRALGGGVKRVVVAVSDALRYEVACELADELERQTRGTVEMAAMQGIFPSETRFGMAALLPHARLTFDAQSGGVLADGAPTVGTSAREKALRLRRPASAAVQYVDLLKMSRSERKAFAADAQVIYVYHNVIDAAGHGETSGQGVFDACDDAVADMVALVRMATNDMGATRVLITADHGFLYTTGDLPEADLASSNEVDGQVLDMERRYVRAEPGARSGALLRMGVQVMDGGESSWWAPRGCVRMKASGSRNYVHGGVSLQELCVPVVRFRSVRAGSKDYVEQQCASLKILSTERRITSSIFNVVFFQPERVGGKVLPGEYKMVFTDEMGNEISDVRTAHAASVDEDERARRVTVKFTLHAGGRWRSGAPCYLVARNEQGGEPVWSEEFSIEMAFASLADLGF